MLEALREEIYRLHLELPRNNLVVWTSGNVSGRDPGTGLVVIKPSGIRYEHLTPENMVVVDLDGKVVEGKHKPSSDTFAHVYVYRERPDVNGVVHTHSTFATAWAAAGKPIPPVLTAICDEFGGPIPLGAYARIGGDEIGVEIVRSIGTSPAILMKNHGVFTIGKTPEAAVKAAVMVEDVARTVYYAPSWATG
jgi:L-ribulose-5-phosphate 4-epimerase